MHLPCFTFLLYFSPGHWVTDIFTRRRSTGEQKARIIPWGTGNCSKRRSRTRITCVKIWFGLVEIIGMLILRGGGRPSIWGEGVICDLLCHFRTWPGYSSQKSFVKIWFGLLEIGGRPTWIFRVTEAPYYGGLHVTCDAHLRTWPSYSSQKSCVKILFELVEPFKRYLVHKHTSKKKKKKNHRHDWKTIFLETSFSGE